MDCRGTGEVHRRMELKEFAIEWKIKNFFLISLKANEVFYSPPFSFDNRAWRLRMYPNGETKNISEGHIGLYLDREYSGPPISLEYTLGLKTMHGVIDKRKKLKFFFDNFITSGTARFLNRQELFLQMPELVPSATLTIVCILKHCPDFKVPDPRVYSNSRVKCSYCDMNLYTPEEIASHHEKCWKFPIKCPKCNDVAALEKWHDHKCTTTKAEGNGISNEEQDCPAKNKIRTSIFGTAESTVTATEKLVNDLKSMMLSGNHSDTIIRVKGEEFRLHRSILASRSPYFQSMFNCNMKEKNTGNVTIDDCEPDVFRSFIHFVYTGKVDKLTVETVCNLYELADKYQENQLKSECLHFMMGMLSVESFCDFTVLAFRHDEKQLLKNAIKFFASKTKEIIQNVNWQSLLIKYPIQANELLVTALNYSEFALT